MIDKSILTFDGDTDSGGTIVNSNATGIGLIFGLHAGSNFNSGNAGRSRNTGAWAAAGYLKPLVQTVFLIALGELYLLQAFKWKSGHCYAL